jgi:hypothetical protein
VAVVAQAVNLHQTEVLAAAVLVVLLKRAATAIHRLLRQAKATMEAPATVARLITVVPVVAVPLPLVLMEHQRRAVMAVPVLHHLSLVHLLLTQVAVVVELMLEEPLVLAEQVVAERDQIHLLLQLLLLLIPVVVAVVVLNIHPA